MDGVAAWSHVGTPNAGKPIKQQHGAASEVQRAVVKRAVLIASASQCSLVERQRVALVVTVSESWAVKGLW